MVLRACDVVVAAIVMRAGRERIDPKTAVDRRAVGGRADADGVLGRRWAADHDDLLPVLMVVSEPRIVRHSALEVDEPPCRTSCLVAALGFAHYTIVRGRVLDVRFSAPYGKRGVKAATLADYRALTRRSYSPRRYRVYDHTCRQNHRRLGLRRKGYVSR